MNFILYGFIGCTTGIVATQYATTALSVYGCYCMYRAIKCGPFCLSLSEIPLLLENCCSGIRMHNDDCLLNIYFAADWSELRFKDNV